MELKEIIALLEEQIENPKQGLPEPVFLLLSRLTPMINVDLLVKNEAGKTLLTWRDDAYYPHGWHIPGGIIRFKETAASRIAAVAAGELKSAVEFDPEPIAVNEIIHDARNDRGHFISLLYNCRLTSALPGELEYRGTGTPAHGQYRWFAECPADLLEVHDIYRKYICRTTGPMLY